MSALMVPRDVIVTDGVGYVAFHYCNTVPRLIERMCGKLTTVIAWMCCGSICGDWVGFVTFILKFIMIQS